MKIKGHAWKFGSNVNTDVIIPGRYCNLTDENELAKHCMEDADPTFSQKIKKGDVIMAENNFGCGSSRELAPVAIKAAGISCVIAKNFARIFFRNAINIGLPILECPQAVASTQTQDEIEVDFTTGIIKNLTRGLEFRSNPFPEFVQRIIACGGLLEYLKKNWTSYNKGSKG